jgi:hypothetical protein
MTSQLLEPLYEVVTAIMVAFHTLFNNLGVARRSRPSTRAGPIRRAGRSSSRS